MRVGIIVGAVLVALLGPVAFPIKPACEIAAEWATAQVHAGTLPSELQEIEQLPMSYRKAVFNALPVGQKRALWTQQINTFVSDHNLTPEQEVLIEQARALLKGGYVNATTPMDLEFANRFLAAFPGETAFTVLGKPIKQKPGDGVTAQAAPSCDCNSYHNPGYECGQGVHACQTIGTCDTWWPHGCGLFYLFTCDGLCYFGGSNG